MLEEDHVGQHYMIHFINKLILIFISILVINKSTVIVEPKLRHLQWRLIIFFVEEAGVKIMCKDSNKSAANFIVFWPKYINLT